MSFTDHSDVGGIGDGVSIGLGYDFEVAPAFLLGAFANFNRDSGDFEFQNDLGMKFVNSESYSYDLGMRLGNEISSGQLLYLSGGFRRAVYSTWSNDSFPPAVEREVETRHEGWFAGLGFDLAVSRYFDLKAEYRFSSLSREQSYERVAGNTWDYAPNTHSAKLGLVFRPFRDTAPQHSRTASGQKPVSTFLSINGELPAYSARWDNFAPASGSSSGRTGYGLGYGATAGVDIAVANGWFAGGEIGYQFRDHDSSSDRPGGGNELRFNDALHAGARIGYIMDTTRIYGGLGYVSSRLEASRQVDGNRFEDKPVEGFYTALGAEISLFENVGLDIQYRYEQYDAVDFKVAPLPKHTVDDVQSLRLGLVFRM